jgi:hypothetical protein
MGRADYYKEGDYNAICDQCGMKYKASTLRMTWDNLFSCPQCWSPKHPQYFVKGLPDHQTVPISRPDNKTTMGQTAMKVAGVKFDLTIDVDSISGISDNDSIGIVLDDTTTHWTQVNGTPSVNTVTLETYLPYAAAIDNVVYIPALNNETYTFATSISATEL